VNIGVDGGALCTNQRFGNYIFTHNFIEAVGRYDKKNYYTVYTFCDVPPIFKNTRVHFKKLLPRKGWLQLRVSLEERLHKNDIFLALNQSIPSTNAKVISISHGLSFEKFPDYYPASYSDLHQQLRLMLKKASTILVSSKKVEEEFKALSEIPKVIAIPFGVPFDFLTKSRIQKRKNYFLFVGMDNQVKQIDVLVQYFIEFKKKYNKKKFELWLVGNFKGPFPSSVRVIKQATRIQLKKLYAEARAYVTTSKYESFNFPALEALSQQCPVIGFSSAIIPEMQKYCLLVGTKKEFIKGLNKITKKNVKRINVTQLKKEFSWKNYIENLKDLY